MIFRGSRYEGANSVVLQEDGRDKTFVYYRRSFTRASVDPANLFQHRIQVGETLFKLAWVYGGNARKWHVIAELNELIIFPLDILQSGTTLLIPTREVFDSVL